MVKKEIRLSKIEDYTIVRSDDAENGYIIEG